MAELGSLEFAAVVAGFSSPCWDVCLLGESATRLVIQRVPRPPSNAAAAIIMPCLTKGLIARLEEAVFVPLEGAVMANVQYRGCCSVSTVRSVEDRDFHGIHEVIITSVEWYDLEETDEREYQGHCSRLVTNDCNSRQQRNWVNIPACNLEKSKKAGELRSGPQDYRGLSV